MMIFEMEMDDPCEVNFTANEQSVMSIDFDQLMLNPARNRCLIRVVWAPKPNSAIDDIECLDYRELREYTKSAYDDPSWHGKMPFLIVIELSRLMAEGDDLHIVEWYKSDTGFTKQIINGWDRKHLAHALKMGRQAIVNGQAIQLSPMRIESREDMLFNLCDVMAFNASKKVPPAIKSVIMAAGFFECYGL
ncbi:hypothetical protein KEM56_007731 [Ascosphaera pollenicola]|nr:hypothetical protein KEM56_007731 [Ascosphaera pollenicola]